jgi:hypothetical protein
MVYRMGPWMGPYDALCHTTVAVAAERQARAEARRIIAGLVERIPAIEAPAEPPGSSDTVEEEPERAESRPDAPGAQEGARRPWWRRTIGG